METPAGNRRTVRCPHCAARIHIGHDPDLGDVMTCPECKQRLEVVGVSPLRLDWLWDDTSEESSGGPGRAPDLDG